MAKKNDFPIVYPNICFFVVSLITLLFLPESGHAQSAFQAKLGGLRDALIGTVLPIVSTIGLVYAAILSISGSGEARGRVIGVIFMSIIGFMAKYIIEFFQRIAG